MSVLLKSIFVSIFLIFFDNNDCKLLPNGNYKIKYTYNSTERESDLKIENEIFFQRWSNGDSETGKIKWIYGCIFKFDYLNKPEQDTSKIGKLLYKSFGTPCIELKGLRGDTINFRTTYARNLHITINEGRIIRMK